MLILTLSVGSALAQTPGDQNDQLHERARRLAHEIVIVDTHLDVPERLHAKMEDISERTPDGDFDYFRAKAGGLTVPFMAVFVPSDKEGSGKARVYADSLIDMVRSFAARWPDKFALVNSPADVTRLAPTGKILIAMGMENGAPIEGNLANVRYFYDRGIRYITLTHSRNNHICDSSFDPERKWNGLSPFGVKLIAEMNRVGMMIDISHVSDSTFYQVIRLSTAPVVASHSSCRAFTPGFERNMSDDMIKALAANGGVIQINFGSTFLRQDIREQPETERRAIDRYVKDHGLQKNDPQAKAYLAEYRTEHPPMFADVADVARHIDHVAKLVGIEHVGIGSDFDGVGDSLPTRLKDVSQYPNLIAELLKLGYSEEDIRKVCAGNILRVWEDVQRRASASTPWGSGAR
jgi:membrane dipeptidase